MLTLENVTFREFVLCLTLLVLKLIVVNSAVSLVRAYSGVFISPEDMDTWTIWLEPFKPRWILKNVSFVPWSCLCLYLPAGC
jgi:hypothetical protein